MDIPGAFRLGESAGCAERVEGVPEAPPSSVAEGDACRWRTNPPQSPTHSIDWCGVVQAVHLRSRGATAAAGDGIRLSEVRTRDSAIGLIWTHKIKGLHRNDFIMAAKTDELYQP